MPGNPFDNIPTLSAIYDDDEGIQELVDSGQLTTASNINKPEPTARVKQIDLFNEFNTRNPKADGGRIPFDKGGAAKFRKFIQDFDGKIYKGFVSDQADKFGIDRSTAGDIIADLRSDIRKKLVERNYDITKSQLEGGKSYADKIKEREDRVAKANVNTPSSSEFKQLSEEFVKDPEYKIKSNANFAKFLNEKGKTATGGKKFTENSVERRRSRLGMTSPVTTEALVNKNFKELKKIATEIGVSNVDNIKDRKKLLTKIYEQRASNIKKIKRATDPEFREAESKAREKYKKANPEKVKKSQFESRVKKAEKSGFPPPAKNGKEELWRNLFVDGRNYKEGRRLKIVDPEKYGRSVSRDAFLNAKILDTKTGKQITFKNLENYINKNTPYEYEKVLKPYAQKWFVNNTPGLRTEINSKLIPNYDKGQTSNFFEIQHNAGRYNDPFDVSLSNRDINLKESTARTRFEKVWKNNLRPDGTVKVTSQVKEAFKNYTDSLPGEILSKPSMVQRSRYFGEDVPFDQQLRDLKQRGVVLPRGTLKRAAEMSLTQNLGQLGCPTKKFQLGGRVNFSEGSTCVLKGKLKLNNIIAKGTGNKTEQLLATQILNAGRGLKNMTSLRALLGPQAMVFFAATEAGLVGADMLMSGKTLKEAVADSLINPALGPKLKQDSQKLFVERLQNLGLSDQEIGKGLMFDRMVEDVNTLDDLKQRKFIADQKVTQAEKFFPTVLDKRKKEASDIAMDIQDIYRTGDRNVLDIFEGRFEKPETQEIFEKAAAEKQALEGLAAADQARAVNKNIYGKFLQGPKSKEKMNELISKYFDLGLEDANPALFSPIQRAGGFTSGFADGGLSGGDKSGPPPESGPMPQGLPGILKRAMKIKE